VTTKSPYVPLSAFKTCQVIFQEYLSHEENGTAKHFICLSYEESVRPPFVNAKIVAFFSHH